MDTQAIAEVKAQMPSPLMKNLPHILKVVGLALTGFSGWWGATILNDPAFTETFGNTQSVMSVVGVIAGFMTVLAGSPIAQANQNKTEQVAIEAKQEAVVTKEVAAVEVAKVSTEPSVAPSGVDDVQHSLIEAQVKAIQQYRFKDAAKILAITEGLEEYQSQPQTKLPVKKVGAA